jgi:hypothetical protein
VFVCWPLREAGHLSLDKLAPETTAPARFCCHCCSASPNVLQCNEHIPTGGGDAVSRTLDYGFADFATAQAFVVLARKLGAGDAAAAQVRGRYMCTRTVSAFRVLFEWFWALNCHTPDSFW